MGVPRQLNVEPGALGGLGAARLVRQEQPHRCVGRRAGQCGVRVAAVRRIEVVGRVVGHAGQHQAGCAPAQHHVLVHQDAQPQAAQRRDPGVRARVVLVVAGHEIGAVARGELRQRRHVRAQLGHAAVDQIAGDGHDVGVEQVDRPHDRLDVAVPDGGAHVHVADLRDDEAVKIGRQPVDRHVDADHARGAPRVEQSDRADRQRRQRHRPPGGPRQRDGVERARRGQPRERARRQQRIAQRRQHEQRRKQPQRHQPAPGDQAGRRARAGAAPPPAQQDERGRGGQPERERPGRPRHVRPRRQQPRAHVGMHQQQHCDQAHRPAPIENMKGNACMWVRRGPLQSRSAAIERAGRTACARCGPIRLAASPETAS